MTGLILFLIFVVVPSVVLNIYHFSVVIPNNEKLLDELIRGNDNLNNELSKMADKWLTEATGNDRGKQEIKALDSTIKNLNKNLISVIEERDTLRGKIEAIKEKVIVYEQMITNDGMDILNLRDEVEKWRRIAMDISHYSEEELLAYDANFVS